jgi:predicted RNA binding protein YcfA (HicA-like mRNA interferase family)
VKLPRDLAGTTLAQALRRDWGYVTVHQTGSHIILETEEPSRQRIVIPAHRVLRVGTLNGILRSVSRHKGVSRDDLLAGLRD